MKADFDDFLEKAIKKPPLQSGGGKVMKIMTGQQRGWRQLQVLRGGF